MNRREFLQVTAASVAMLKVPSLHAAEQPAVDSKQVDSSIKDYLFRIRNPDMHHAGDVIADERAKATLKRLNERLLNVRRVVGFGNFNVLGFDDMLNYSRRFPKIGDFDRDELNLLESLFYEDAARYGFYGKKPLGEITQRIDQRDVVKIPGTGHYLFAGEPVKFYEKVRQQIGDRLILTSGVRSVVKQMQLFVAKAERSDGNLSLASRSLAPPGYSFHGIGDFDVGVRGWGGRNFTDEFATTDEFKRLLDLGYVEIRYPEDNRLGVRFEPWHIKVT
ncbi:MAG: M15 family metallopeptidase [Gammaproteobacteria bacterium]|nr:M15 family metallopeptidase [Gammaproteobacteria bacterium]